ncbi:CARDB domain-containing protein, partial [Methermicoccus shengliensis]|uniref:CARDB domain-containing protein n=1 Tax=Methermicoccus shengliensis TaxID=660064 RepID=UPI0005B2B516
YTSPWDSVDQYSLTGGEYVLFATGQYYPFYPLHILAPPYVPSGKPFQVTVTYYNDTLGEWDLLEEATVLVNDTPVGTTGFGGLTLTLSDGTYALRAEKAGYIRSEKVNVTVGGTHIPPGEQPDLTVFLMLPPHVPPGEQMKVFGVVCNERNGTADTSTLKILANGTSINETTLPVLGPYGVYPFDFNWTPLSEGPLNITAIADYYDVVNESNESNNTATQYVMVGGAPPNGVEVFVRVESNTTTLFADVVFVNDSLITMTDGSLLYLDHPTALGALAEASRLAGFTFNVTNTTSGPYITDINGDSWVQYRVNFTSPNMSADQYTLTGGEYVLFATGQYWPFYPLHIIAPPYVPSGVSFNVTVIYYNDTLGNWTPIAGATVLVDGAPAGTTDAHGNLSLSLADGMHDLRAEKTGYIRSEKVKVNVGVGEKKPPVNITWSTTINATNELEGMMVGMAPDATDGYDPQYDA